MSSLWRITFTGIEGNKAQRSTSSIQSLCWIIDIAFFMLIIIVIAYQARCAKTRTCLCILAVRNWARLRNALLFTHFPQARIGIKPTHSGCLEAALPLHFNLSCFISGYRNSKLQLLSRPHIFGTYFSTHDGTLALKQP